MSGPGRNEPCPCGSGEKFKRCCGAPARTFNGDEARQEMGRILAGNAKAESLLDEIATFYGPRLTLVKDSALTKSGYKLEVQAEGSSRDYASTVPLSPYG